MRPNCGISTVECSRARMWGGRPSLSRPSTSTVRGGKVKCCRGGGRRRRQGGVLVDVGDGGVQACNSRRCWQHHQQQGRAQPTASPRPTAPAAAPTPPSAPAPPATSPAPPAPAATWPAPALHATRGRAEEHAARRLDVVLAPAPEPQRGGQEGRAGRAVQAAHGDSGRSGSSCGAPLPLAWHLGQRQPVVGGDGNADKLSLPGDGQVVQHQAVGAAGLVGTGTSEEWGLTDQGEDRGATCYSPIGVAEQQCDRALQKAREGDRPRTHRTGHAERTETLRRCVRDQPGWAPL